MLVKQAAESSLLSTLLGRQKSSYLTVKDLRFYHPFLYLSHQVKRSYSNLCKIYTKLPLSLSEVHLQCLPLVFCEAQQPLLDLHPSYTVFQIFPPSFPGILQTTSSCSISPYPFPGMTISCPVKSVILWIPWPASLIFSILIFSKTQGFVFLSVLKPPVLFTYIHYWWLCKCN